MAGKRCTECGAELRVEAGGCPLCGAEPGERQQATEAVTDVDGYQGNVRRLREQLRRLREDAEAV